MIDHTELGPVEVRDFSYLDHFYDENEMESENSLEYLFAHVK